MNDLDKVQAKSGFLKIGHFLTHGCFKSQGDKLKILETVHVDIPFLYFF